LQPAQESIIIATETNNFFILKPDIKVYKWYCAAEN